MATEPERDEARLVEVNLPRLPATAVQALYHAATGKTENLTKHFVKNYVARQNDLNQVYYKVLQQIEHYQLVAGPTVTIKIGFHNGESQQFSSWERFSLFDTGKTQIVSDVVIKFEFLIELPDVSDAQRYIITIDIDSKLPVVADDKQNLGIFHMLFMEFEKIPSLTVSVDYIDYLCAKHFVQLVEDWFNTLEESSIPKWLKRTRDAVVPWPAVFSRFGNLGAAAFLALYAYQRKGDVGGSSQVIYLISVTIVLWTLFGLFCGEIGNRFRSMISRSFIPASVILTVGDQRAFQKLTDHVRTTLPKLCGVFLMTFSALALNVLASFVYAWLTKP